MSTLTREALHGVRQIVRFNWPLYAAAAMFIVLAATMASKVPSGGVAPAALYAVAGLAAFWTLASLVVSWIVYDRSGLMSGDWITPALGSPPRSWLSIHAGLDELTPVLRRLFGESRGRIFDIFDAGAMTEPSISRARRSPASRGTEQVDFRHLPVAPATIEAAFLLLSAHELRSHVTRCALLAEVRRATTRGGRAIVAEHLRNLANAAAFGPGALHFHSRRAWTRAFEQAGFVLAREFSITPFVRVFVLEKRA